MKRFCSLLLVSAFLTCFLNFGVFAEKSSDKKTDEPTKVTSKNTESEEESSENVSKTTFPKPRATSAIVIDANSGDAIYAQDAEKKLPTAGT